MSQLITHQLSKRYGIGPEVISNANFVFNPGTITGLYGKNGSGKTTLLNLLSVFSFPTSGNVTYKERDIHKHPIDYFKTAGFVLPFYRLPRHLSLNEIVNYRQNALVRVDQNRMEEFCERLYFFERRDEPISTYSSGMMKKAEIITAMSTAPEVLILDEPFETLDDASRVSLQTLLQDEKLRGAIVLVATHNQEQYRDMFDSIINFPLIRRDE